MRASVGARIAKPSRQRCGELQLCRGAKDLQEIRNQQPKMYAAIFKGYCKAEEAAEKAKDHTIFA